MKTSQDIKLAIDIFEQKRVRYVAEIDQLKVLLISLRPLLKEIERVGSLAIAIENGENPSSALLRGLIDLGMNEPSYQAARANLRSLNIHWLNGRGSGVLTLKKIYESFDRLESEISELESSWDSLKRDKKLALIRDIVLQNSLILGRTTKILTAIRNVKGDSLGALSIFLAEELS